MSAKPLPATALRPFTFQLISFIRILFQYHFCGGIQGASPVDSYVRPEASEEPGYTDQVVMASGSFTEGSTIELSCDGPLRAPYTCYLQGGLNFAASRAGVLSAVQNAYFAG